MADDYYPVPCVICEDWHDAGRRGAVIGRPWRSDDGMMWSPVLWDGEEDPSWHKTAGLKQEAVCSDCGATTSTPFKYCARPLCLQCVISNEQFDDEYQ